MDLTSKGRGIGQQAARIGWITTILALIWLTPDPLSADQSAPADSGAPPGWTDLYRKARSGDNTSQAKLGDYYYARGNHTNAVYWYRKAAEAGDPGAQVSLSRCYARGEGVPKNLTEAKRWASRSFFHQGSKTESSNAPSPETHRSSPTSQDATLNVSTARNHQVPATAQPSRPETLIFEPLAGPSRPPLNRIKELQPPRPRIQQVVLALNPTPRIH